MGGERGKHYDKKKKLQPSNFLQDYLWFYVQFGILISILGDYCDVYLTHDSISVRKAHNSGRNHIRNVVDYYQRRASLPFFLIFFPLFLL